MIDTGETHPGRGTKQRCRREKGQKGGEERETGEVGLRSTHSPFTVMRLGTAYGYRRR